ncbi:hypothetical protein L7F22_001773 [Adiantum nelumboides]|nr:hypothetical protein [Adiantum nelumboides]
MLARRVAPTSVIAVLTPIGRAKVGSSHKYGGVAWQTPLGLIGTLNLKACPAAQPVVEQCCAQCCSVNTIPLLIKVSRHHCRRRMSHVRPTSLNKQLAAEAALCDGVHGGEQGAFEERHKSRPAGYQARRQCTEEGKRCDTGGGRPLEELTGIASSFEMAPPPVRSEAGMRRQGGRTCFYMDAQEGPFCAKHIKN